MLYETDRHWDRLRSYLPADTYQMVQHTISDERGEICTGHLNQLLRAVTTYLPHHLAFGLLREPVVAKNEGQFLEGTLLFADISGFTRLSEKLKEMGGKAGAEELVRVINGYLDVMLDILFKHNGQLIKFGGDAMLCLFTGDEHGAMNALWAAWEMRQVMLERFSSIEVFQQAFPLSMKAGGNSGLLFAATVGTVEHMEYILTGSAVERTAHAESAANKGDLLVSDETCQLVKENLEAEEVAERPGFYRITEIHPMPPVQVENQWVEIEGLLSSLEADLWGTVDRLDALTPYLPVGVLPQLVHDPRQGQVVGQHRQVTVLFANFVGMSEIIHARGLEDVEGIAADLSEYLRAMQEEVQYYGGVINKVDLYDQGDKLMVIFGAPHAHEQDAQRAALTALAMQEAMGRLSSPTAATLLSQRIGIHTGFVFAGNVGSAACQRREYTVMGDTVNLAARLMSAAAPGKIWVSQAVWEQIQAGFQARHLPPIRVKGISEPLPVYQLQAAHGVQRDQAWSRVLYSDLVGRERELETLDTLYDDLLFGAGKQIVAVTGEGGVGKSRLIIEWQREAATSTEDGEAASWQSARGHSYGQKTQGIFIEVLEHLLDFADDDAQEERWSKLSARVRETLADAEPGWFNDFSNRLAYLGQFLAMDLSQKHGLVERVARLEAETLQIQTRLALCDLLEHAAGERPLVLLLDDLHWADDASLELLEFVIDRVSDDASLLFCLIYRPQKERRIWQTWQEIERSHPDCHSIALQELGWAEGRQLLANLLQASQLAEDFQALVHNETDGNPLYIEEVLHALIEDGTIVQKDGRWQVTQSIERIHVPDTLYQIIQSRIDELDFGSPGARRVLWMAAVIGEEFDEELWLHLFTSTGREKKEFSRHLRELRNAAMVERVRIQKGGRPRPGYRFRHGLVQQVAYENTLVEKRRNYHCQVGRCLEKRYAGELPRHYDTLAYHYSQAEQWEKAAEYCLLAGAGASRRYTPRKAIEHYTGAVVALNALPGDETLNWATCYEGLGDAHNILGEFKVAIANYQNAFELLDQLDKSEKYHAADIARRIGRLLGWQADHSKALAWMEKGLAYIDKLLTKESRPVAALLHIHTGSLYYLMGQHEGAAERCQQGLELLTGTQHLAVLGEGYNLKGVIHDTRGETEEALACYEKSIACWDQVGDPYHRARVQDNVGTAYFYRAEFEKARSNYERVLAFWEKIGDKDNGAYARLNLGGIHLHLGLWKKARRCYQAALNVWREMDNPRALGIAEYNLGILAVEQGNWDEARGYLEQSLDLLQTHGMRDLLPETYRWLAELACGLGDAEQGLAHARQGLTLAEELGIRLEIGANHRVLGKVLLLVGDAERAQVHLTQSLSIFEELGSRYELGRTHLELARLYKAAANRARSETHREAAIELFSSMGARKDLERARSL